MNILIVDDDPMVVALVRSGLEATGWTLAVNRTAAEARAALRHETYDALILDVLLPDGSGWDLVADLRADGLDVPVLMLTGKAGPEAAVQGLESGADDHLSKPFDVEELKARLRAIVRRRGRPNAERLEFAGIMLDRLARSAAVDGKRLRLTPKEYSLLENLMLEPDQTVSRSDLLRKVWNIAFDPGSNLVDAHIARLRGKLRRAGARAEIGTQRGAGFRLLRSEAPSGSGP
jgi:DNA-binding response OmpR family regulator